MVLFKIYQSWIKYSTVPIRWCLASEVLIPKVAPLDPSTTDYFRRITLLNVEGKLFFTLISKRIEDYILVKNKLINVSFQKGCMAKVPGSWEHMSLVWDKLKTAKSNKSNIVAVWLDIANAYGSAPHHLVLFALEWYWVSQRWIKIIKSYYGGLGVNRPPIIHHLAAINI